MQEDGFASDEMEREGARVGVDWQIAAPQMRAVVTTDAHEPVLE